MEEFIELLMRDYTHAPILARDRPLLDYAVKLAREPWSMTSADIDKLRAAGWSDSAILDVNLVASYYAFVNRVAGGLGVELEARCGARHAPRTR